MTRWIAAGLLALSGVGSAPAAGQKPPPTGEALTVHPEAREAIGQLKSPYCPGMMLEVCPSPGGAMLRDSIQSWAEAGLGADSMVERIVAEYGEQWRAEPLRSGTGRWAWLVPPVVLVAGLGGVGVILAGRRRRATGPEEPSDVTPEDEARLKDAIAELEAEEEPVF